jgi:hypothetical protein
MLSNIDFQGLGAGKDKKPDPQPVTQTKPPPPPSVSPSLLPAVTAPLIGIAGIIVIAGILLTSSKK